MRISMRRRLVLLAVFLGGVSCEGGIADNWGVAGYAQVQGVALRADSTPIASVFISCGPTAPDFFGDSFATDSLGRFDVTIRAPGLMQLPDDGLLHCRVSAPADSPALLRALLTIPFTKDRVDRVVTEVELAPL
jgi:hypothetical protein